MTRRKLPFGGIGTSLRRFVGARRRRPDRSMEERVARLESGWDNHLPLFLNAITSVRAFGYELFGVRRDLEKEIAALRRELDAQARRLDAHAGGLAAQAKPTVAASPAGLKVNLADGPGGRDGFVNVGAGPGAGIDIVADAADLPFAPASVGELDVNDLPQRVARERLVDTLLPHWRRLLVPGGRLCLVVRDASAMLERLAANHCTFGEFQAAVFGVGSDGEACAGRVYTPESLRGLLETAGFVTIEMVRRDAAPGQPCPEVVFVSQRRSDPPA